MRAVFVSSTISLLLLIGAYEADTRRDAARAAEVARCHQDPLINPELLTAQNPERCWPMIRREP
jgi:hypothetical protein